MTRIDDKAAPSSETLHPESTSRDGSAHGFDANGYLLNPDDWDEALAVTLADADGLRLEEAHWRVLYWLRDYFARHGRSPAMRVLVREIAVELGSSQATSRALYRLFPQGPAKQAARYAGLPRPTSCI